MPKLRLEILIEDKRWKKIPGLAARLQKTAEAIPAHLPKKFRIKGAVNILLTDDAAMRRLNRDFRGKDKPTNVLSFPAFAPPDLAKMGKKSAYVPLGDIAFGYQYIVVESKNTHKILINHARHLLIHGILHLFGYDHISGPKAVRMETLEQKIMRGLGLPDPYAMPQPKEPKAR